MDIHERLAAAARRVPSTEPRCPLVAFREDVLKVSRRALAKALGVSFQAITNAEYGTAPPSRTFLETVEALGYDAQALRADWYEWMAQRCARIAREIRAEHAPRMPRRALLALPPVAMGLVDACARRQDDAH